MDRPRPVPGAKEGLETLKKMGYTLIIITARSESQREGTEEWLAENMPDSGYLPSPLPLLPPPSELASTPAGLDSNLS